jgi:polyribonucleotide nucleotidyltransferase
VSYTRGRTQIKGVSEQGAKENISKIDEVTDDCGNRNLHNEEFHNFYSSPNIIKMVQLVKLRRIN